MSLLVDTDIIKDHQTFINVIRHNKFKEKKELAQSLRVSFPTMENEFKILKSSGIIDIQDKQDQSKFIVKRDFGYFLGIAVGATETKVSLVDFSFKPVRLCENYNDKKFESLFNNLQSDLKLKNLSSEEKKGDEHNYLCFETEREYLKIYEMCNKVLKIFLDFFEQSEQQLLSIALSLPGIIDEQNIMRFSPNIPELLNIDVSKLIKNEYLDMIKNNRITFLICHDTIAATVYEKENLYTLLDESYCKKDNMAVLYMGSGLGCGLIIHNQLVLGALSAGEIGHINFTYNDLPMISGSEEADINSYSINGKQEDLVKMDTGYCACGKQDCLERLIRVKVFNANSLDNYLEKTTEENLTNFSEIHPYRYRVLKELIGKALNVIINLTSVDLIAFTGRIFNNIPQLKEEMESLKTGYSLNVNAEECHILTEKTPNDSVAIGAAILSYYKMCGQFGKNRTINWSLFDRRE